MPAIAWVRLKSFGVNTAATPSSSSARASRSGMMPPTIDRDVVDAGRPHPVEHVGHQLHVRAGEDREPDAVHVLGDRGGDDLLGRQPDALVDDLEAGVAGAYGDLLGAVGVPVETGLADQQPQPAARAPRRSRVTCSRTSASSVRRPRPTPTAPETPVGARNSPNTSRSAPAHSPVVTPARARGQRRRHQVGVGLRGRGAAPPAPRRRLGLVALRPATPRRPRDGRPLGLGVDGLDRGVEVGGQRDGSVVCERVDADDDLLAGLDPGAAGGVRADQRLLHVAGLDRGDRAAHAPAPGPSRPGRPRRARPTLRLDHERALEDVVVLQQVGLEGQHLLQPQRPLLVPRPRQAERLVPRGQLHGAGAGVLATA